MSLTLSEVQAHISDQALAAAISAGDDIAAASRLSELLTEYVPIQIGRVAAWGAMVGLRSKIQDYANTQGSPLRDVALSALDLLIRGNDFDVVDDGALLDVFVASGDITQAQRDQLTALAIGPRTITANEVARAIRNDDGSSKL